MFRLQNIAKEPNPAGHPPIPTTGQTDNECQHFHALLFPGENLSLCCMNKNVQLAAQLPLSAKLQNLYLTRDKNSRYVQQNMSFAMAFWL